MKISVFNYKFIKYMTHSQYQNHLLSEEEYNKYARHIILDQIGIDGQYKLKQSKVIIVGAGGLGCPSILYLATSGVGHIGIIDNDTISISNLHRQILYTKGDLKQSKTIVAKKKISEINSNCTVNIYPEELSFKNAFELIKQYDIVIDASDNFITRYILDEACYRLHKVHIYGAIQGFEGHTSVFNYQSGPRYSDLYPKSLNLQDNNCNTFGILGVLPGIIGIIQATEAIKIITGIGKILSGYLMIYNALNMSFKKNRILTGNPFLIRKDYSRQTFHKMNNNISYTIIKQKPITEHSRIIFIDVRQRVEFQKEHIENAINIPLRELTHKSNITLLINYSNNYILILYCSHNSRSIIASNVLYKYNIRHLRLTNGYHNWKLHL